MLLEARPQIARFPRAQAGGSSCRLGTCAKASAGKRSGTSGQRIGQASLPWALAGAAGLLLRPPTPRQPCRPRLENQPGQGYAVTMVAHQLARAVSSLGMRGPVCELAPGLNGSGSRAGEPAASRDPDGLSLQPVRGTTVIPCVIERAEGQRRSALIPGGCLDTRSGFCLYGEGQAG